MQMDRYIQIKNGECFMNMTDESKKRSEERGFSEYINNILDSIAYVDRSSFKHYISKK